MFTVAVAPEFDFLSEEYERLFAQSCATAFQHPIWLDGIYRKLVPQLKAAPLIVTVRDAADGCPVMVLPLVRRRYRGLRTVEFADLEVSDYVMPVASDAMIEAVAADPFACRRISAALKPFDLLRIRKLRSPSEAVRKLLGVTDCSEMAVGAHAVPLGSDFSAWRAENISAALRKELDKKTRQLHGKGQLEVRCATDAGMIETTLLKMREYRRRRFETGDLLQNQIYFDFYLDVATRAYATLSRFYCVLMDGVPIAGIMALSHEGSLLILLTGFDYDGYRSQSLGLLTFEMVTKLGISAGYRELDFTIGDEPYKALFGAKKSPIYQIVRSGSMSGVLAEAAMEHAPWVKSVVRRFAGSGSKPVVPAQGS